MKKYKREDFGPNAKDFTCKGECSRCGNCCVPFIPITLEERNTIQEYIKENDIKPHFPKPDNGNIFLNCVFHDRENNCCTIYPVRPEVCKAFKCNLEPNILGRNREYYDKRADINGKHSGRFVPMDLLFYDSPICAIFIAMKMFDCKSDKDIIKYLSGFGSDQKFLTKHNISNCLEIAEAIALGKISLEWSDNND